MKKYISALMLLLVAKGATAIADDSEVIVERNKTLGAMAYREQQLKMQASMAESYKKMAEAGFIVDENGTPLGVPDIQTLGSEIRKKDAIPSGREGTFPGEPGFSTPPFPGQMPGTMTSTMAAAPQSRVQPDKIDDSDKKTLQLKEIRADGVLVNTSEGIMEVKIGQKVHDYTLKRVDAEAAYFSSAAGTRVERINWTNGRGR